MDAKYESQATDDAFYARVFALLTVGIIGFLLYQILQLFFAPLAWALFIAFLLQPLNAWLLIKLKGRANLTAMLLTIFTMLVLVGPLTALAAAFFREVGNLLQYAQEAAGNPRSLPDLARVPVVGNALEWLQDTMGFSLAQIQGWAVGALRNALEFLASMGGRIFLGALSKVTGFVLAMFMLFFVIRDGGHMLATARALVPLPGDRKARLFAHLAEVLRAVFYGHGVTALIQGALVGIGFAVVGLPSPIVFGVLGALLALVPLVGTPVVWLPAVVVLAFQQRWFAAAFLLTWGIIVATIDNLLRPWLVAGLAQVSTLTVFIGAIGGASAFGAVGLFIGPLVLALLIALVRFTLELRASQALSEQREQQASAKSDRS